MKYRKQFIIYNEVYHLLGPDYSSKLRDILDWLQRGFEGYTESSMRIRKSWSLVIPGIYRPRTKSATVSFWHRTDKELFEAVLHEIAHYLLDIDAYTLPLSDSISPQVFGKVESQARDPFLRNVESYKTDIGSGLRVLFKEIECGERMAEEFSIYCFEFLDYDALCKSREETSDNGPRPQVRELPALVVGGVS